MSREFVHSSQRLRIDVQKNGQGDIVKFESAEHEMSCEELRPGALVLRSGPNSFRARVVRQKDRIYVWLSGRTFEFQIPSADEAGSHGAEKSPEVRAPMPGTLIKLLVTEGDAVEEGQVVAVLEAMKMEHQLRAPLAGTVQKISGAVGSIIDADAVIVALAIAE